MVSRSMLNNERAAPLRESLQEDCVHKSLDVEEVHRIFQFRKTPAAEVMMA